MSLKLSQILRFSCSTLSLICFSQPGQSSFDFKGAAFPPTFEEERARLKSSLSPSAEGCELFEQAKTLEKEQKYEEAFEFYLKAALKDFYEGFISAGYLIEGRHIYQGETVEERRLIDALSAFYLEKGVLEGAHLEEKGVSFAQDSTFHGDWEDFEFYSEEEESETVSFQSDGEEEEDLSPLKKRLYDKALELQNKTVAHETTAQKRLRYASAARYFEESALWYWYPPAYTSLGHMYMFGRGIDISDMPFSAQLQAREYYEVGSQKGDPVAKFMLGFLEESKGENEALEQAQILYQDSVALGFNLAAYRLGSLWEQGQGQDGGKSLSLGFIYDQAESYYKKAASLSHEDLPLSAQDLSLLKILVNMPKDLSQKREWVRSLKGNPEALKKPVYSLLHRVFCDFLKKENQLSLLPYWVDLSLAHYAALHQLPYRQDETKSKETVKEIALTLSNLGQTETMIDLTALEQKMMSFTLRKIRHDNGFREMSVRQRLVSHEGEKWSEPQDGKPHSTRWFETFLTFAEALSRLSHPFEKAPFLTSVSHRLSTLSAEKLLGFSVNEKAPDGYMDRLKKSLNQMKEEAEVLYDVLPPCERSLGQQYRLYKDLQLLKEQMGVAQATEDIFRFLTLTRELLHEAGQSDQEAPHLLLKHFQSARALDSYAQEKNISLEDAKTDLQNQFSKHSPLHNPDLTHLTLLGYDVIQAILTSPGTGVGPFVEKSRSYREGLFTLLSQEGYDTSWVVRRHFDVSLLSGSSSPAEASLSKLYEKACERVKTLQKSFASDQPCLNLEALTFEDPYIGTYGSLLSDSFQEVRKKAQDIYEEGSLGASSPEEVYQALLDEDILAYFEEGKQVLGEGLWSSYESPLGNIVSNLQSNRLSLQDKIRRKECFLFVLKKGLEDWSAASQEETDFLFQTILNGTDGRCPDGQADFFQQWYISYILEHPEAFNLSHGSLSPQEELGIHLSFLLQDYKDVFLQRHGSPFIKGESDSNENRTAMKTLLLQMMRLPLNLVGSYNKVLYPYFAKEKLKNPEETLSIDHVIGRFLGGGNIVYEDIRVTPEQTIVRNGIEEVLPEVYHDVDEDGLPVLYTTTQTWPALTLKNLAQRLRESFSMNRPVMQAEEGLLPLPQMSFVLSEEKVKKVLETDSLLSSFYHTFMASDYEHNNIFFDGDAAYSMGVSPQYYLRDAALLRLLEISGYAFVPEGFYQTLTADWKMPSD